MPIYVVRDRNTGEPMALVDARLPAQAEAFVARRNLEAIVAKPADLINLTKRGFDVELVGSSGQQLDIEEVVKSSAPAPQEEPSPVPPSGRDHREQSYLITGGLR